MIASVVAIEGLSDAEDALAIAPEIQKAAALAINDTARKGRTLGAAEIRKQANLPARYVTQNLNIIGLAKAGDLEAEIVGRFRPTSLARYAKGTPESTRRAGGTTVTVKPGLARFMKRAFLIRLRGIGGSTDDGAANIGLAIRLKPGEVIRSKKIKTSTTKSGLTLLYSPSIDQLFRTVRDDISPELADYLQAQFVRQSERLSG